MGRRPAAGPAAGIAPLWVASAVALTAHAVLAMAAPPMLQAVIAAIRDPAVPLSSGLGAAVGLAATSGVAWLAVSHGFLLGERVAIRIRASLTQAVYESCCGGSIPETRS